MIEDILRNFGLSKNEAKIYLALLELGPSLIGKICVKTKIHRRNVYDSIEMLKDKGFVSSVTSNNRNIFDAFNPNKLIDMLDEKKAEIKSALSYFPVNPKKTSVRIYAGQNGRKLVFEDKLKCKGEQYVLGANEPSGKSSNYVENYHIRRIAAKIPLKMLFIHSDLKSAKKFKNYKFVKVRILPDIFNLPIAINIYSNKTAILLQSGSIEPITILVEDRDLAKTFKAYFNSLWKMSQKV